MKKIPAIEYWFSFRYCQLASFKAQHGFVAIKIGERTFLNGNYMSRHAHVTMCSPTACTSGMISKLKWLNCVFFQHDRINNSIIMQNMSGCAQSILTSMWDGMQENDVQLVTMECLKLCVS